MTPRQSLARATELLDEATENLTFDEYVWALEEAARGVAWALNAVARELRSDLGLGAYGRLPPAVAIQEALSGALYQPPGSTRLVRRIGKALLVCSDGGEPTFEVVEQIVFDAWDLHDACGRHLRLVDDRLGDKLVLAEVSPGRIGSPPIPRRTALKLLAAGTVLPLQACKKVEKDNRPPSATPAEPAAPLAAESVHTAKVARVSDLDQMHWPTSDPFLFCAHHLDEYPVGNDVMGPAASLDGRQLGRDFVGRDNWRMYHGRSVPGFPRHPHRGFETVTVVRTGMLDHADSMGAAARYGGGDVQWLTAGGGIQHAEMFPLLSDEVPNPLELFQIWLNLPRAHKMVDPYFTMLWSEKIPRVTRTDAAGRITEVTVAAGQLDGQRPPPPPPNSWASQRDSDLAIWSIRMEPGARFEMPAVQAGTVRSLYVHRGAGVEIAGRDIANRQRAEVEDAGKLPLVAGSEEAEILLLQARPIGEPVAKRGPFVMNTQDEIRQAYADYQQTQFGGWPWDRNDPVHARTNGRFARHIDGRHDEPT